MPKTQHNWSYTEFETLCAAVIERGKKWELIQAHYFPKISIQGIRNMYYKLLREDPVFKERCQRCAARESHEKAASASVDASPLTYIAYRDDAFLQLTNLNSIM